MVIAARVVALSFLAAGLGLVGLIVAATVAQ